MNCNSLVVISCVISTAAAASAVVFMEIIKNLHDQLHTSTTLVFVNTSSVLEHLSLLQLTSPVITTNSFARISWPGRSFFSFYRTIVANYKSVQKGNIIECNTNCFYVLVTPPFKDFQRVQEEPILRMLAHKVFVLPNYVLFKVWDGNEFIRTGHRQISQRKIFNPTLSQLRNAHMRIGVLNVTPYVVLNSEKTPQLGLGIYVWRVASGYFNFSYDFKFVRPNFSKHPNGSWAGVLGDLISGDIDILFMIGPTPQRFLAVEYGTFGIEMETHFIVSRPMAGSDWTSFLKPFDWLVWTVLAFSLACLVALFQAISGQNSSVLAIFGPVVSQPAIVHQSLRIQTVPWVFGSMIIVSFYNSNLLSHITSPAPAYIPRDFTSLANREDYAIYTPNVPGGFITRLFQNTRNPQWCGMHKRLKTIKNYMDCVVKAGMESKTACVGLSFILLPSIHSRLKLYEEFTPVVMSDKPAASQYQHSVLQKGSKYTQNVDFITGWARNCGLIKKWFRDVLDYSETFGRSWLGSEDGFWVRKKLISMARGLHSKQMEPIGIHHLFMGLVILFSGYCISTVTVLTEVLIRRFLLH